MSKKKLIIAFIVFDLIVALGLGYYFLVYLKDPGVVLSRTLSQAQETEKITYMFEHNVRGEQKYSSRIGKEVDTAFVEATLLGKDGFEYENIQHFYNETDKIEISPIVNEFIIEPLGYDYVEFESKPVIKRRPESIYANLIEYRIVLDWNNIVTLLRENIDEITYQEDESGSIGYAYSLKLDSDYFGGVSKTDKNNLEILFRINQPTNQLFEIIVNQDEEEYTFVDIVYLRRDTGDSVSTSMERINSLPQSELAQYTNLEFGSSDAVASITEYVAIGDPFGNRYFSDTYPKIKKNYLDKETISYVIRPVPLFFIPNSQVHFMLMLCGFEQGQGQEAFEQLNKMLGKSSTVSLDQLLKVDGLIPDKAAFKQCFSSNKYLDKYDELTAEVIKERAFGSPLFKVKSGNKVEKINGAVPYETFKEAIDKVTQTSEI